METIQSYLANMNAKEVIKATDDKVVLHYKSIFREYELEFLYNELQSKVIMGKTGESNWQNWAGALIVFEFVGIMLLNVIIPRSVATEIYPTELAIAIALGILSLCLYLLRLIKFNYVYFSYIEDDEPAFSIRTSGRYGEDGQRMVQFIKSKIEQVHASLEIEKSAHASDSK